jgi:hypothetical protein
VFVATVSKSDFSDSGVTRRWLTNYKASSKIDLSAPQLVKLKKNAMLLLWTENSRNTRYVFLNGAGEAVSRIFTFDGVLTSGRPILRGNQVCWVYEDGSTMVMARIAVARKLDAPELKGCKNTSVGIQVNWGKVDKATGYCVYRRKAGQKWSKIATVKGATKTSWVDKGVKAGQLYYYTVKAYKGKTLSGYTPMGRPVPRLLPPGQVTSKQNWHSIDVKWKKSAGASGYIVYRRQGKGSWKRVAETAGVGSTEWNDWYVEVGKIYTYRVKAVWGNYSSVYSEPTKTIKIQ